MMMKSSDETKHKGSEERWRPISLTFRKIIYMQVEVYRVKFEICLKTEKNRQE